MMCLLSALPLERKIYIPTFLYTPSFYTSICLMDLVIHQTLAGIYPRRDTKPYSFSETFWF